MFKILKRGKNFLIYTLTSRDRAVRSARKAHNLEVVGSNPAPATKKIKKDLVV